MKNKRDFLIWSTALLSGMFSFFFFRDFIGWDAWWQKIATVGLSVVIQVALGYYIEQTVRTGNKLYIIPVLLCVATSVLGSVGSFQAVIQRHLDDGERYNRLLEKWHLKKRNVEIWQDAALNSPDRHKGWRSSQATTAAADLDQVETQLASIPVRGIFAVDGFKALSKRYKINSTDLLFWVLVFIALFIDGLHWLAKYDSLVIAGPRIPARKKSSATPPPSPGGRKKTLQAQRAKIQQNKARRILQLRDYLEHYPSATLAEMADAIGVSSRETVRKYLDELERNGFTKPGTKVHRN